jgi:glutamine cyclotransferase
MSKQESKNNGADRVLGKAEKMLAYIGKYHEDNTSYTQGKLFTLIDSIFGDTTQGKASKDIIKTTIWDAHNRFMTNMSAITRELAEALGEGIKEEKPSKPGNVFLE